MRLPTNRGTQVRDFVLREVNNHPRDIVQFTCKRFNLSRQTVNWHIRHMVNDGLLIAEGKTRSRSYSLKTLVNEAFILDVSPNLEEDVVWRERVLSLMTGVPKNVLDICQYGFTEMLDNVREHSGSNRVIISIKRDPTSIEMLVDDQGVGIFEKIQKELGLHDPKHALLELTKGKLSTNPQRHSGEGIFFTSRMFNTFSILSGPLFFGRTNLEGDDWLLETADRRHHKGTLVSMTIQLDATHTMREVFDRHTSGNDDFGFTRTHVPLELARYEGEQLVSRSQARRLLARVDRFKEVLLDFKGITMIGQAFADEIFRVFQLEHLDIVLNIVNAPPEVMQMIRRVRASELESNVPPGQQHLF